VEVVGVLPFPLTCIRLLPAAPYKHQESAHPWLLCFLCCAVLCCAVLCCAVQAILLSPVNLYAPILEFELLSLQAKGKRCSRQAAFGTLRCWLGAPACRLGAVRHNPHIRTSERQLARARMAHCRQRLTVLRQPLPRRVQPLLCPWLVPWLADRETHLLCVCSTLGVAADCVRQALEKQKLYSFARRLKAGRCEGQRDCIAAQRPALQCSRVSAVTSQASKQSVAWHGTASSSNSL